MQQQQRGLQQQHGSSNNTAEAQEIEHVHAKSHFLQAARIVGQKRPDTSSSESNVRQTASRTKSSIGGRVRTTIEARTMAFRFWLAVVGEARAMAFRFWLAVVGGCGAGLVGQFQLVYHMVHSHRQQSLDWLPATIKGYLNKRITWCVQNQPLQLARPRCHCRCGCRTNPTRMRNYCEGLVQDGFRHPDIVKMSKIATEGKHTQNLLRGARSVKAENPMDQAILSSNHVVPEGSNRAFTYIQWHARKNVGKNFQIRWWNKALQTSQTIEQNASRCNFTVTASSVWSVGKFGKGILTHGVSVPRCQLRQRNQKQATRMNKKQATRSNKE